MVKEIIFGVIGGLGLFIYGIVRMSEGLHKASGDRMRRILHNLTGNPVKGVLVGTGITAVIQSSSATTVMVVGFVNAGLMSLVQALGVTYGANIGATTIGQLIAFRLTEYALPIIGVGMVMLLAGRKKLHQYIGEFLLGFGILFLGLNILTEVIHPLRQYPWFNNMFITFGNNPFLAILTGAIVTGIIQSSSVTIGMVLGLAMANMLDLKSAIPLVLGCDIGTCATAMLGSIGTNVGARRAAVGHLLFNVIGAIIMFPLLGPFETFASHTAAELPRQIANANTLYKIVLALLFLPCTKFYASFLTKIVPGKEGEEEMEDVPKYLERHLLSTPPIAIEAATKEIVRVLGLTQKMVKIAMGSLLDNNSKNLARIGRSEEAVDSLRTAITNYLVEIMQKELSVEESRKIPPLIHAVNDVERIGDHAENLRDLAEQKIERKLPLSNEAAEELRSMYEDINKMIGCSVNALSANSVEEAKNVLAQECGINSTRDKLKNNHVKRLERSACNVLSGVVFLDTISNLEKIGDHLNNVAQAVIEGLQ